jgi:hypothetical protein
MMKSLEGENSLSVQRRVISGTAFATKLFWHSVISDDLLRPRVLAYGKDRRAVRLFDFLILQS